MALTLSFHKKALKTGGELTGSESSIAKKVKILNQGIKFPSSGTCKSPETDFSDSQDLSERLCMCSYLHTSTQRMCPSVCIGVTASLCWAGGKKLSYRPLCPHGLVQ